VTRQALVLSAGIVLLSGCATQTKWTPTVDTYGNSRSQYLTRDLEECRALAKSASGDTAEEAAYGAGIGAVGGAAAGALIGAIVGNPGRGAALGAVTGAAGLATVRGTQTQAQFEQAYRDCMSGRGHNVIG